MEFCRNAWKKEFCRNVDVDVSCFLLFEASGDSEVDLDPVIDMGNHENNAVAVADIDDAESCSCDSSDYANVNDLIIKGGDAQEYEEEEEKDNEGEEEVNSNIDQTRTGKEILGQPKFAASKIMVGEKNKKSRVRVDRSKEVMNEMEKNKLFWETCLAS